VTGGAAGAVRGGEIAELIRQATGEDAAWLSDIGPSSRLDGDLLLDSLEIVVLDDLLRARYGDGVDLAAHLAGLEIDEIIAFSVDDVADYVTSRAGHGAR